MSGLELLKEIRSKESYRNLPFIFLTANCEKEKVIEAVKNGANDYIVKPATIEILETKLRQVGGVKMKEKEKNNPT